MSCCILDCSAIAGWCFVDEKDIWAEKLLDEVVLHGALVPSHWHLEVSNMFLQALKRNRTTFSEVAERIQALDDLKITVDIATHFHAFHKIMQYAQQEKLTSYDAAYLELSLRRGLPLATKDNDLKKACKHLGVNCV